MGSCSCSCGSQFLFLILTTFLILSPSSSSLTSSSSSKSSSTSITTISTSTKVIVRPTKLIDSICNQTRNYNYCVDALYTDRRASNADQIILAYISFAITYTNATNTQAYITNLVKSATNKKDNVYLKSLKRCSLDYKKAVFALEEAYNNLNSETYFDLGKLASVAAHAVVDCQHVLKPIRRSTLTRRNGDVIRLCDISALVSNLFTS